MLTRFQLTTALLTAVTAVSLIVPSVAIADTPESLTSDSPYGITKKDGTSPSLMTSMEILFSTSFWAIR